MIARICRESTWRPAIGRCFIVLYPRNSLSTPCLFIQFYFAKISLFRHSRIPSSIRKGMSKFSIHSLNSLFEFEEDDKTIAQACPYLIVSS